MSEIVIQTRQQRLIIDPPTRTVAIMPVGPIGPQGLSGAIKRNRVINGGFDSWQRGAGPFTRTNLFEGTADDWCGRSTGSSLVISREAFTAPPPGVTHEPRYFLRATVGSVVAAGNRALLLQTIEGVTTFSGQTVTISFWAKADAPKNIAIEFYQGFGSGGTVSGIVTGIGATKVAIGTTWQRYSVTTTIPSTYGKTIGTQWDGALVADFWFDAGTNYDARTAALGHQSGVFDLWGVQVELGSTPTPFEHQLFADVLNECQRYFVRLGGQTYTSFGSGFQLGSLLTASRIYVPLPRPMRFMSPSTTRFGPSELLIAGNTAALAVTAATSPLGTESRLDRIAFAVDVGTSLPAGAPVTWRAANNDTAYLEFSNENGA